MPANYYSYYIYYVGFGNSKYQVEYKSNEEKDKKYIYTKQASSIETITTFSPILVGPNAF